MIGIEFGAVHQHSVGGLVQVGDVARKPPTAIVSVCNNQRSLFLPVFAGTCSGGEFTLIAEETANESTPGVKFANKRMERQQQ